MIGAFSKICILSLLLAVINSSSGYPNETGGSGNLFRVSYIKMKVIDDLKSRTINSHVQALASNATVMDTNDSTSYVDLKNYILRHNPQVIPKEKVGEVLPWGHLAISNAKKQLLSTYHDINPEILQNYLNEFCYMFNRRYFGDSLFNRLLVASA